MLPCVLLYAMSLILVWQGEEATVRTNCECCGAFLGTPGEQLALLLGDHVTRASEVPQLSTGFTVAPLQHDQVVELVGVQIVGRGCSD